MRRSDLPTGPASGPSAPLRARLQAGLIFALLAVAYRDLALWDPRSHAAPGLEGWFFVAAETTPQIVFLLVAALLYRRRARLRSARARASELRSSAGSGIALLLAGVGLFAWARHVGAPDLETLSLLPLGVGGAHLVAGRELARAVTPPLALLIFAIQIPAVVLNQVMFACQLVTARLAEWALGMLGVPAVREGLMLFLSDSSFRVIETCSGLRSVETLTLLALAYVVFFEIPRLHAAVLLCAAPVIAFLLNGVRVTGLILTPGSEVQSMHILQGAGMFLLGIAALCLLDWTLMRVRPTPAEPRAEADPLARPASNGRLRRVPGLAGALAVLCAASFWMPVWTPPSGIGDRLLAPRTLEGFRVRHVPGDPLLGAPRFTRISTTLYERDGESVALFLGYGDRLRRQVSLVSPKTELPGPDWSVEERSELALEAVPVQLQALVLRSGPRRILAYHGYLGVGGLLEETLRAALALDHSPLRREAGEQVIRLSTEVGASPEGLREAHDRLRGLLAALPPSFWPELSAERDRVR